MVCLVSRHVGCHGKFLLVARRHALKHVMRSKPVARSSCQEACGISRLFASLSPVPQFYFTLPSLSSKLSFQPPITL